MKKHGRYEKTAAAVGTRKRAGGKLAQRLLVAVLCLALVGGFFWANVPNNASAAQSKETVADNRTLNPNNSPNYATNTKNVGRIWTDKSVSTDSILINFGTSAGATVNKTPGSDFIIGLSAMSSTSTLTTNVSVPLDIVLVLDVSGSMAYGISDQSTSAQVTRIDRDDMDTSKTYYIKRGSGTAYSQITYSTTEEEWGYYTTSAYSGRQTWTSLDNNTAVYSLDNTRLQALKSAVNGFITATEALNKDLAGEDQHRIAVVKFAGTASDTVGNDMYSSDGNYYNYTQLVTTLTTDADAQRAAVNSLGPAGSTRADNGLAKAQSHLATEGRANAKKIVIFFTDGSPSTVSSFNSDVAMDAITISNSLKGQDTLVYSVAVVNGTNPENFDQDSMDRNDLFLHAVSSNFISTGSRWSDLELGTRTNESRNYYKATSNAAELNQIFDQIFKEISSDPVAPTHVSTEAPHGYVTFRDELGEFMEVKGFNGVYINGVDYTQGWEKTVDANGVITYTNDTTISGGVNDAYNQDQSLSLLKVTVIPGTGSAGDLVTVEVPAALLPLRKYDVDANGHLTIDNAQPFRAFYSVGLKAGVEDALLSGQLDTVQGLRQYVQTHTFGGRTHFYANDWDYVAPNSDASNLPTHGGTTVTFTPAETNSFYFYVSDTPLYILEGNQYTRLTRAPETNQVLYYQRQHYALEGDTSIQLDGWVPVTYVAEANNAQIGKDTQGYYIKAGTPKISISNAANFRVEKPVAGTDVGGTSPVANPTQTATYATYPAWSAGNSVNYLGNNGRISYIATGSLEIAKTVTAADGLTAPDKEFTVSVQLSNANIAVAGAYTTTIRTPDGEVPGSITIGENGTGTLKLKGGQTVVINGLPEGTVYTLTETQLPGGFTQTAAAGTKVTDVAAGIKAGQINTASFTNHYAVAPVTIDGNAFPVTKVVREVSFDGTVITEWKDGWRFDFELTSQGGEPMPANTVISITEPGAKAYFGFKDVSFDKPGEYVYGISEVLVTDAASRMAGINYSHANYRLQILVTDNGDGTMTATPHLYWVTKDDGTSAGASDVTIATFNNAYDLATVTSGPQGFKVYTDLSGGRPLAAGDFQFTIYPVGSNATEAPKFAPSTVSNQQSGLIDFSTVTFDHTHVGNTYTYEIREVKGNVPGMSYSDAVYQVDIQVTTKTGQTLESDAVAINATWYSLDSQGQRTELDTQGKTTTEFLRFANTYAPEGVAVDLAVQKTLTGRDWMAGDSFAFTLTGYSTERITPPMPANAQATVTKDSTGTGAVRTAAFGPIYFDQVGVYTYHVTENGGELGGVTYDGHTSVITVTVTDPGTGVLQAEVAYNNASALTAEDQALATAAAFTNAYKADKVLMTPAAIRVTKELTGRSWHSGDEFTFMLLPGASGNPMPSTNVITFRAADANSSIYFDDVSQLTFTEAGTYEYYILEKTGTLGGIIYDRSVYKLEVQISDPGTGALVVSSQTFYKATAPQGLDLNEATVEALAGLTYEISNGATAAAFTNAYHATEVIMTPSQVHGYKQMIGRPMRDGEEFVFTLTLQSTTASAGEPTGVMLKGQGDTLLPMAVGDKLETSVSGMGEESARFDFGNITFTQEGTYTFIMKELQPDTPDPFMSYESHECVVTVKVTDNGRGQLIAAVTYAAQEHSPENANRFFNHYYNPGEAKTVFGAGDPTISLDGKVVSAGQILTYNIHWENNSEKDATVTIEDTIPEFTTLVEGSISGNGVLSQDGSTITWTLSNILPHGQVDVSFQVRVDSDVTTGGDITNQAQINGETSTNITHNYLPGKSVENNTVITAGEDRDTVHVGDVLTYTIRYYHPGDGQSVRIEDTLSSALAYVSGSASDNGTINGNVLSWTVASNAGDQAEWKEVSFQAKVTQEALGMTDKLTNQAIIDNQFTTNVIGVELPATSTLVISKLVTTTVDGLVIPAPAGGYFNFMVELYEPDGKTPLTDTYYFVGSASGSQNNTIKHGDVLTIAPGGSVTISGLPVGTVYKVTEVVQGEGGYVSGAPAGFIQVAPADDSGAAVSAEGTVSAAGSTAAFTNEFTPAVLEKLTVNKQVSDADHQGGIIADSDWRSDWNFAFNLTTENGAPMPGDATGRQVAIGPDSPNKSGSFGTIYYTAPGVYRYVITEDRYDHIPGITKSYAAYRVWVTVAADETGALVVESVRYAMFVDDRQNDVTDPTVYTVGESGAPGILFTNLYRLEKDSWTPTVVKQYTNTANADAAMPKFTFQIEALRGYVTGTGEEVNNIPSFGESAIKTVENDAAGMMSFGLVEFTADHEGNTYEYLIHEVIPGTPVSGMAYDANRYIARVVVTSEAVEGNGKAVNLTVTYHKATQIDGQWRIDETDNEKRDRVIFSNTYTPTPAKVELNVKKNLTGRNWLQNEFFGFTLANMTDGAPMPADSVTASAAANAHKTIQVGSSAVTGFGEMEFKQVGDYFYQIVENVPGDKLGGLTYDEHSHYVWVKITDDGNGALQSDVKYFATTAAMESQYAAGDDEDYSDQDGTGRRNHALFTNRYEHGSVTLPDVNLTVQKNLTGRSWLGTDKFFFTISSEDKDAPLPASVRIEVNSGNYTGASFGDIVFTEPGTYIYTIAEEIPQDGTKLPGVTYDETKYVVTMVVRDNGDSTLSIVSTTYEKANAADDVPDAVPGAVSSMPFTNTYKPADAVADIRVEKILNGRAWKDGDSFTFTLTAQGSSPMPQASSVTITSATADHVQTFGSVTYDQIGTYRYTITETVGDLENVTYDRHTAVVVVEVYDDPTTGMLKTSVTYDNVAADAARFVNVYYVADKDVFASEGKHPSGTSIDGEMVSAGQILTYTIDWANTSGQVADVIIRDKIPAVTTIVRDSTSVSGFTGTVERSYANGEMVWQLKNVPIGASGKLTFQVRVTDTDDDGADLTNQAKTIVGTNEHTTDVVTNYLPGKTVDKTVSRLGEEMVYTIRYYHPGDGAVVEIKDILSENLDFVSAENGGVHTAADHTIRWSISSSDGDPGMWKSVTFKAKLNAGALNGETTNKAMVGHVYTNEVRLPKIETKNLFITKTVEVVAAQGTTVNSNMEFTFRVELTDAGNAQLPGEYSWAIDGQPQPEKLSSGSTITLKHGQTAVISDLPAGTKYTVTETDLPAGYSAAVASKSGSVDTAAQQNVEFINTYDVEPLTEVVFQANKVLNGPEGTSLSGKTFQIGVYTTADCVEATMVAQGAANGSSDENGNVTFGTVTFTSAGTHTFFLKEIQAGAGNIKYDSTIYRAVVTVVDELDGTLRVSGVSYSKLDDTPVDKPVFTNEFVPGYTDVTVDIVANKELSGWDNLADWAGKFTFGLFDKDGNLVATGTNAEDGTITFKNVVAAVFALLEEPGTEVPDTYPIDVTVTDGPAAFFKLNDTAIPLTEAELALVQSGETLGLKVHVAGSAVSDADKSLIMAAAPEAVMSQYLNITLTKVVAGVESPVAQTTEMVKMTFAVEAVDGRVYQVVRLHDGEAEVLEDLDGAGNGTITIMSDRFSAYALVYTDSAAPETTEPEVTEPETTEPEVTEPETTEPEVTEPETTEPEVTEPEATEPEVTEPEVTEPETTEPEVTEPETTEPETTEPEVTEPEATEPETTEPEVTEPEVTEPEVTEPETTEPETTEPETTEPETVQPEITVPVADTRNEPAMALVDVPTVEPLTSNEFRRTREVQAEPEFTFGTETSGEFTFTLREQDGKLPGVTYDETVYVVKVKVTVVDDKLTASEPQYFLADGVTPAEPVFKNSYDAADTEEVTIQASKVLTNRTLADKEFTFQAVGEDGTVFTAQNNAKGEVIFNLGKFTQAGSYPYTVSEKEGSDPSIIYSSNQFTVTVVVTDDGSGKLSYHVEYPEGGVKFDNYYKTPDEVVITAKKVLTGRGLEDKEFEFQILSGDTVLRTARNDGSGTVAFEPLIYDHEGTYSLTVREVPGNTIGMRYDPTEYNVQVVVTVGTDGALKAEVLGAEDLVFTNHYTDPTPAKVTISAHKVLSGRDMVAGEFTFQVLDGDKQVLATGKNDASGNVTFSEITFDRAGDYTLTLSEVAGDAIGVDYDTAKHTVKVSVTLTEKNQLVAEVTYPEGGATFTNTFTKAKPVQVVLSGTKYLTGRTLKDKEFSFLITDAKGNPLTAGTNDASGKIAFGALTFSEEGTYQVIVSEVSGNERGVIYDEAAHTVTIQVELTKDNQLKATISYPETGVTFHNIFDPHPNPETGDETVVGILVAMLMLSGFGIAVLVNKKRRFQA